VGLSRHNGRGKHRSNTKGGKDDRYLAHGSLHVSFLILQSVRFFEAAYRYVIENERLADSYEMHPRSQEGFGIAGDTAVKGGGLQTTLMVSE
jgi:hypothetical protein